MHIVIAGNIGSGKTTLAGMLSRHYGWEQRLEPVTNNPYLEDYYSDMRRWALPLEVFFLKERFRDLLAINRADHPIIQDRSIFEGVYIFTANNHDMGNMDDRDFQTYMELFADMMMVVRQPDLMIYLRASVEHLVGNIQKRGRAYEQNMPLDYLQGLNRRYEHFINDQYHGLTLTVDAEHLDFEHRPQDFAEITRRVDNALAVINDPQFRIPNLFTQG